MSYINLPFLKRFTLIFHCWTVPDAEVELCEFGKLGRFEKNYFCPSTTGCNYQSYLK